MKKLWKKASIFKSRLFRFSDEEMLSRPSKVIILILDIVVLSILFSGLDEHTRQLTRPNDYLPWEVRELLIHDQWFKEDRLTKLEQLVLEEHTHYSYYYQQKTARYKNHIRHPLVHDFFRKIEAIKNNSTLHTFFLKHRHLSQKRSRLHDELQQTQSIYQTSLLEDIANVDEVNKNRPSTKQTHQVTQEFEHVLAEINELEGILIQDPLVVAFFAFIDSDYFQTRRSVLIEKFRFYERWYPIKEFFWQLLFLAPLFVVFYIWNSRSIKKNQHIQVLLSSHLLIIASIPILLQLISFVVDLIPNHLFTELFNLLKGLRIIAIWHYLVIFFSILIGSVILAILQKKLLSQKRIQHKRVLAGNCYSCGKKIPPNSQSCPSCGEQQYAHCTNCHELRTVGTIRCNQCGSDAGVKKISKT